MFARLKRWLFQSYQCRYCDGTGYESNLRMLWNGWRSWAFVALVAILAAERIWAPAARPAARPHVGPPSAAQR